ncbi:Acetyltransferase (GNAT) family protein [compost metagenome]
MAAVNIRHKLTDALMNIGGHIGYGVRPSQRRQGNAARMLALALDEARALGIERALVTCNSTNTGSEKTILKNGGVADAPYTDAHGAVIKRFWIALNN